jgi:hypothetical protein
MTELPVFISPLVLQNLRPDEKTYLVSIFDRFNGYPKLDEIWQLMDEQWVSLGCDPNQIDERVTAFYRHPVWLLNGLFIEQDPQSLENRHMFTDWIAKQAPRRVADFGGGFGGLARFMGKALPSTQIEVVEPHPHPGAMTVAASVPNVRFVPELSGRYDMLVATDVFEHVPDPLALAAQTASHLHIGGLYLIASCFRPVILCHLPQLHHFHYAWDRAMSVMGLEPGQRVKYGRVYLRKGDFDVEAARKVGECAKKLYPIIENIPKGKTLIGKILVHILASFKSTLHFF